MKKKILIVEDDVSILTGLVDLLSGEGFTVLSATNGEKALSLYKQNHPDLILLDVMVPEIHGYDLCKEIRKKDPAVSIIMLTAKGKEVDKVVGLQLGADDYITKPFGIHELLARIHAVLRRRQSPAVEKKNKDPFSFGDVHINVKEMTGKKGRASFDLTEREIHLLQLFVEHPDEVLERDKILEEVWGISYGGTTRTLDQHIVKLRQKIESNPAEPKHILTVHGVGYRFCH